jgi:hypothetical protein
MVRRLLAILFMTVSLSFAGRYVMNASVLSDSSVGFSQSQTVAQKLQTAPVAYYGSLIQRKYLQKEFYKADDAEFEQKFPEVYKSFVGWSNHKLKRQNELLSRAPEEYQRMFEERYSLMDVKGFFLIHDEIRVDKVYDKATKTWVTPKPEDAKKELFSFAYVGPDISVDSTWKISQRMMVHLHDPEEKYLPVKRIFFMDGYSEECYSLMDTSFLEKIHYYPHRLKYDVKSNETLNVREEPSVPVEKANIGPFVKKEGGLRFNTFFDFGRPFLLGDFPDFDPKFYLGFGFNVYIRDFYWGLGISIRTLDAKCDSCGTGDFGAHVELGYLWLKTKYIESGAWGNLGFSAMEVPPIKGNPDSEYQHERYFRYGFGIYVDALFPSLIGKPLNSFWEKGLGNRFGVRLKLGLQNMNISEIGHAKGFSPFVSLGFTWHLVKVAY